MIGNICNCIIVSEMNRLASHSVLHCCCQNEGGICVCRGHRDRCAEDLAVLGGSDWPDDKRRRSSSVEFLLPCDGVGSTQSKSVASYCRRATVCRVTTGVLHVGFQTQLLSCCVNSVYRVQLVGKECWLLANEVTAVRASHRIWNEIDLQMWKTMDECWRRLTVISGHHRNA